MSYKNNVPITLTTHCMECGKEYDVKSSDKREKLMFCSDSCSKDASSGTENPIMYDQDGIMLNQ